MPVNMKRLSQSASREASRPSFGTKSRQRQPFVPINLPPVRRSFRCARARVSSPPSRQVQRTMAKRSERGFTLIELMITVAVIGVLVAVAYPSYLGQVRKSNRSAAQQFMADVASREQQLLLDLRSYVAVTSTAYFANAPTAGNPGINLVVPTSTSGRYTFAVAAPAPTASAPLPTFTITATAVGNQAVDGNLTLDSGGTKTPANKW
jgi:type IV pilus assembly protein PilE